MIKAEVVRLGEPAPRDNPRFVVTDLRQTPRFIYEKVYGARGDIENRIKELLDGLQIDRTSCCRFWANQVRVFLTAASEKHFASCLRLVSRTAVSGGKPLRHTKTGGTASTRVAGVLRMAALSLQRSDTALGAAFRRTARYKGGAVAIFVIARKLAVLVYRMLRFGQDYVDLGEAQYEARFRKRRLDSLRHTAQALAYTLTPAPNAA